MAVRSSGEVLVGGTRQVFRVAVVCALAGVASAAPAHAEGGEGPGSRVGRAVQQVAQAHAPVTLPVPAQQPGHATPPPGTPVPKPSAPAAPEPAGPAAPVAPAPGGPAGASGRQAPPAPSSTTTYAAPAPPAVAPGKDAPGRAAPGARSLPAPPGVAHAGTTADTAGGAGSWSRYRAGAGAPVGRGDARAKVAGDRAADGGGQTGAGATAAQSGDSGGEGPTAQSGDSGGAGPTALGGGSSGSGPTAQGGEPEAGDTADPVATGAQPAGDSSGALPFTGSGALVLIALGLFGLAAGLALRRMTRRVTRPGA
jgi:translation initiation factor IF-2